MRILAILCVAALLALFALGCEKDLSTRQRETSVRTRSQVFARAEVVAPIPQLSNFPTRRALAEFTQRQDLIDHPWYVYILSDVGGVIGYYVAKTRPINSCNFLSSTEEVRTVHSATIVLTAPSLDGIYYGGAGATSGCDEWFFFDSATNALIEIRGVKFFAADQPLRLEAEPIVVAQP